jgi:hypothetical protein
VNVGIFAESLDIAQVLEDGLAYEDTKQDKERNLKDFGCKHDIDGVVVVVLNWELADDCG